MKKQIQYKFNQAQLVRIVQGKVKGRDRVTRQTLARWIRHWRFTEPYEQSHAEVLAHYADLISFGYKPDDAKAYTIEHFEQQEDAQNV